MHPEVMARLRQIIRLENVRSKGAAGRHAGRPDLKRNGGCYGVLSRGCFDEHKQRSC